MPLPVEGLLAREELAEDDAQGVHVRLEGVVPVEALRVHPLDLPALRAAEERPVVRQRLAQLEAGEDDAAEVAQH